MENKNRVVKPKKKPLQIYLTEKQREKLGDAAYGSGLSINEFVLKKLNSVINK